MSASLIRIICLMTLLAAFPTRAEQNDGLQLQSVVIVSRHGVRAPTKLTPLMQNVTPDTWPQWSVPLGWLTPRGGELISLLGDYQRQRLISEGLINTAQCPSAKQVAVIADTDERTRKTGEAFISALAPHCALPVHVQQNLRQTDPLFNPLKTGHCQLDKPTVRAAILKQAGGSIEALNKQYQPAFTTLADVLNFRESPLCQQEKRCTLPEALPSELEVSKRNVSFSGAWGLASTVSEIFLLQQAQGMADPGWGRIKNSEQWQQLLSLHNAQFDLLQRTPEVASSRATPLLDLIIATLTPGHAGKQMAGISLPTSLLFIAGHDTNLVNLGGALGMSWTLPGQPDNTPPGGELVFERWHRTTDNTDWIQVSLVYQTLQQMRNVTRLSMTTPPGKVPLTVKGCQETNSQGMCSLKSFTAVINTIRNPACAL